MNKKKSLLGLFGLIFLILALVASNDSSSFSNEFDELINDNEIKTEEIIVIGSKVLGLDEEREEIIEVNLEEEVVGVDGDQFEEEEEGDQEGYRVTKVVDGDTIDVEIDGKVERLRLIGIDTPETVDPRKSVECYGLEASNRAKELLFGKYVTLESDDSQNNKDRYGRLLRYVIMTDGTNFNNYMISEGYAYEYTYRNPYIYQLEFKKAQAEARENNRGLWNQNICPAK